MTTVLLTILAAAGGILYLKAEALGSKGVAYVAKPLVTLALLAVAAFVWPPVSPGYRRLIVIGLALSAVGDVLLMLPRDRFLPGLFAFLLAHVAYVTAFVSRLDVVPIAPFLPFLVAVIFLLRLLWPGLGRVRFPVAGYAVVMGVMAGTALAVAVSEGGTAWLAALGAVLFALSDAALALDRFVGELPSGRTLIMGTYWPAQWLIALSVFG